MNCDNCCTSDGPFYCERCIADWDDGAATDIARLKSDVARLRSALEDIANVRTGDPPPWLDAYGMVRWIAFRLTQLANAELKGGEP